jgi:gluconolactonase
MKELHTQVSTASTAQAQDPMFDRIVSPEAKLEKVAGGFGFIEGPIWVGPEGCVFSDIPNHAIFRWSPDGSVCTVLGPESGIRGPNGVTLDGQRRLTICQQTGRKVSRREKNGSLTTLADKFEGKQLNSPNDCVHRSDGSLYFTDPPFGLPGRDQDPAKELPFSGIYRLWNGDLQLLSTQLKRPNGLAFSPGEKYLYVSNSEPERKIWLRFDVAADGALKNETVFFDATSVDSPGLPDGMKLDVEGNLYCTGPGGIWIFSPQGKHLGTLTTPEIPANCNWGDADGRTLYITARTSLYRIRLNNAGIRPVVG